MHPQKEDLENSLSIDQSLTGSGHNPYDGSNALVDSEKDESSIQSSSKYVSLLNEAEQLFMDKEYVAARLTASNLALDQSLPDSVRSAARDIAIEVGKVLSFSPLVLESDPFSIRYEDFVNSTAPSAAIGLKLDVDDLVNKGFVYDSIENLFIFVF